MRRVIATPYLLVLLIIPCTSFADIHTTMKGMMTDMTDYVYYLEDSLNQEIVHVQADIITQEGATFTRTLRQGWTYGLAAFGDWRIKDLDIKVYVDVDGQWNEVIADDESDNHPVVVVEPSENKTYLIELTVYKWEEEYSAAHYGLLIYHQIE